MWENLSFRLIEQISDRKHNLVGRGCALEILGSAQMAGTIHRIIGVLAVLEGQQVVTRNLFEESPVLAEEVR